MSRRSADRIKVKKKSMSLVFADRLRPNGLPTGMHDWLIDWLIEWLSDWVIEWLSDWVIEWVIEWLSDWVIEWLSDWVIEWLSDWVIEWLSDWLIDWLIDWLWPVPSSGLALRVWIFLIPGEEMLQTTHIKTQLHFEYSNALQIVLSMCRGRRPRIAIRFDAPGGDRMLFYIYFRF